MTLLLSGAMGALVAMALVLVGRSSVSFVAGLVALFPTFGVFAHVTSFYQGGSEQVRMVALFGFLSLVPYAAYLAAVVTAVGRLGLARGLLAALLVWAAFAAGVVLLWQTPLMQGLVQRS